MHRPGLRGRALLLTAAMASFALLPMGAGLAGDPALAATAAGAGHGGAADTCWERMLDEVGWLDAPGTPEAPAGLRYDVATREAFEVAPPEPEEVIHESCSGKIRPGARFGNIGCTMNFIFEDEFDRLYLGTAGHCVSMSSRPNVAGVPVQDGIPHSEVIYDGLPGTIDFALARINPLYYQHVDPTMCHWGGPSAQNDSPQGGDTTHIYGFGLIYGSNSATRPRTGVVTAPGTSTMTYIGFAQPGDSGAPLLTGNGEAVGVHVASSIGIIVRIDPSPKFATRLTAAVAAAEAATGLDFELVSSTVPFSLTDGYTDWP